MHPLTQRYNQITVVKLKELKEYPSSFAIPKIIKATVNAGIGDIATNSGTIDEMSKTISLLTGQKPVTTKARKAISSFKTRRGMVVGLKVTLRGTRMRDFIFKLSEVTLLRTRDFRGLKKTAVSANGNLNLGIKDISIFPDLPNESLAHPIQVIISSTAKTLEEALCLYTSLGFVFQEAESKTTK